eukprot:jgi/Bigna1/92760/estExt_fgenesh1_pm.C_650013
MRALRLKFQKVQRRADFKELCAEDLSFFQEVIGQSNVITDASELEPMNKDWMHHYEGQSKIALCPETTEQLSEVMRYCNLHKIAMVPQGGNTGLVGGSTPVFDEVIVSTKKMNKIQDFDDLMGILICDAGCVLQSLDEYLRERGFLMPLDLGAKGSCHIGGNVATNAGGVRYVRYGSLRGNILGMEAVLPDGTILDNLSTLRKDNTGYDVKQLLIGSEGTLGIITKLAILTPRLATSTNVALLGLKSFEDVLLVLGRVRSSLVDILSAVEFLDRASMKLSLTYLDSVQKPLPQEWPFYMLVETSGSNAQHDREKLDAFLFAAMEEGSVADGVLAQDEKQKQNLWRLREGVAESLSKHGYTYKYDVSVPCKEMYTLVESMRERLDADATFEPGNKDLTNVVGYGHLGDGNLHLNVTTREFDPDVFSQIEPYIFERVSSMKGSISAEHGVGRAKAEYLHMSKSENTVQLMRAMKQLLDPNGVMNPYKMFPAD